MKKIKVLGTEYTVRFVDEPDATMREIDACGYTDYTTKEIVVENKKHTAAWQCENQEMLTRQTIRHELLHAFLYEAGIPLNMLFHSEEMVEWVAAQFPKILDEYEKAGAVDA